MTDTTSVTMVMNADGDIVGASYDRDGYTISMTLDVGGGSTDRLFHLSFLEGTRPLLTAEGSGGVDASSTAQPASATLALAAEGLHHVIVFDATSLGVHVLAGDQHEGTVDFSAWPVLLAGGPLPPLSLPADVERKLAPLEPVLRLLADQQIVRSHGVFSPWPTRPSTMSPVATFVGAPATTDSLCGAACDASYAAVGVVCCAAACPTSACLGCVVCAAASAAGASACHTVVCHE